MNLFRLVCFVLAFLVTSHLFAKTIDYTRVSANVPYAKIAELRSATWDNKFSYGEHSEQYVLHWRASNSAMASNSNRLIFIHGGCWLKQYNITHSLALTTALAQQGFDVFSIEYRRTGNGGEWPVALEDIESAIKAIEAKEPGSQHSRNGPRNGQSITLIGHSAGGHLASLAAYKLAQTANKVHFVGLAPVMDLPTYSLGQNSCQTATPSFMQGTPTTHTEAYKVANPLTYKFNNMASATVFSGGQDNLVPFAMSKHPQAKMILLNDAGHFDWIHPGSIAFKTVVEHLKKIGSNE